MMKINKIIVVTFLTLLTFSGVCNAAEWFEGGTLTDKGALIWQEANLANKVASSSDFVATMYQNEMLSSSISNKIKGVNDLAPYAIQLAVCIDGATEKQPNPKENKKIYANQKISSMAALCLTMMGWVK